MVSTLKLEYDGIINVCSYGVWNEGIGVRKNLKNVRGIHRPYIGRYLTVYVAGGTELELVGVAGTDTGATFAAAIPSYGIAYACMPVVLTVNALVLERLEVP